MLFRSVAHLTFKDHQNYTSNIIKKIDLLLKKTGQKTFFTTEKDWIKLPKNFTNQYKGSYIKMDVKIKDSSFNSLIKKIF